MTRAAVGEGRVGDEQGEGLPDPPGEVLVDVDADDTLDVDRVGGVDVDDAGVGMGAAHEGCRQGVVTEVVEVATAAGDEARVLLALDRRTEHLRRHAGPPPPSPSPSPSPPTVASTVGSSLSRDLGSAQHALDDVLVARAATEVARDRFSRLLARGCRVLLEVGGDRREETRCAEAALQAVALGEGLLHRAHRLAGRRDPGIGRRAQSLDRRDLVLLRRHGEHEAGAHRGTVDEHRARATHAVLAADVGAGEAQVVPQEVGQQPAGRHGGRAPHAVHGHRHLMERLHVCHRRSPSAARALS